MDHYQNIYTHEAEAYHQMISAEDVDGNLLPALKKITSLENKSILDLGTGTGRIPLLVKHLSTHIVGIDLHLGMLIQNYGIRSYSEGTWNLLQGDMRRLPFPLNNFEIIIAGWALGHFGGWYGRDWKNQAKMVLEEMQRVGKPNGVLIILETMGTGSLIPEPPSRGLARYYTWLEQEWGFQREIISTDYQFANLEQAVKLTKYFFGSDLTTKIRGNKWVRLPEWTGIWSKRI